MRKSRNLVVFSLILLNSCKFNKIQKSDDWKEIYTAANKYYEEKEYYKANVLLDIILPIIKGTKESENANFIYSYTYFYQEQYVLSANYFKQFFTIYSRSDRAIEANYMYAYSLYMQSPNYSLDQASTYEAVSAFQAFINNYPISDYAENATAIIDKMQKKLEIKAYENAKQYHKLGRYKSAIIAFDNFEKDFPDSKLIEEILYLTIDTEYSYAKQSIYSRKKERYTKTIEFYQRLIDKYPDSKFIKQAEKLFAGSVEKLYKINNNNNNKI